MVYPHENVEWFPGKFVFRLMFMAICDVDEFKFSFELKVEF